MNLTDKDLLTCESENESLRLHIRELQSKITELHDRLNNSTMLKQSTSIDPDKIGVGQAITILVSAIARRTKIKK